MPAPQLLFSFHSILFFPLQRLRDLLAGRILVGKDPKHADACLARDSSTVLDHVYHGALNPLRPTLHLLLTAQFRFALLSSSPSDQGKRRKKEERKKLDRFCQVQPLAAPW